MADEFDPIHVDFLLNDAEVKKKSANIRKDITGTDATVQQSAQKVGETVKRVYDQNVREVNEYTAAVTASRTALRATTSQIGRSASGFNTLNHSINQISRELPAFAVSAQIGILALSNNIPILADEIKKLKLQNDQLIASGQKGVPVWKTLAKGIFSWQTALSLGITLLTIYGREFADWIQKIARGGKVIDEVKDKQAALNDSMQSTSYKKALQNIFELSNNFELVKEGALDADKALESYNKTMGKVVGEATNLNKAEQLFVANSDNYVQALLYREAAKIRAQKNAEKLVEFAEKERKLQEDLAKAQQAFNPSARNEMQEAQRENINNALERINVLREERQEFLRVNNSIFKEFKRKELAFGFDFDSSRANTRKAVSNRQALLDRIAALDKEYARKRLNSDEEEIQALKDKFAMVRQLVERFNSNPANKGAAIALGGLNETEAKALSDLKYKHETKALAESIEEQRSIFRAYEEFRLQFGKEAADKRFANERAAYSSYSEFLQSKLDENKAAMDAVAVGKADGGQTQRAELLQAAAEDEANSQQAKFDRLIAQLRTYQERRLRIEEEYQEKEKALSQQYQGEDLSGRLEVLRTQKDKELNELNEAAFKESELYRDLNERILDMTRNQIQEHLDLLRNALRDGFFTAADGAIFNLTDRQIAQLERVIGELELIASNKSPISKAGDSFGDLAGSLYELSDSFGSVNASLAATLETTGDLLSVLGDTANAAQAFGSGDTVGGIVGSSQAVAGFIRILQKSSESRRQAAAELREIQHNIEDGDRRYNELLRERNILLAESLDLTLKQIEARKEALFDAQSKSRSEYDALFDQLQNSRFISASRTERYGGVLGIGRRSRVVNDYSSLLGKTYEEIEELYEKGQLEDRVAELFEQLKRLKEEGVEIDSQLQELQREANQIFTGTTQDSIADGIIQGLKEGENAVEDFAGDMEQLLQDSILNAIKYQTLEEPLSQFYQEFADFAESNGGLSESEIEQLRETYQGIVGNTIEAYDQLSQILDQDLLSGSSSSGLQGAIRRELTEATASELTGLYRATFDVMKRQENAVNQQLIYDQEAIKKTHNIMLTNALIEQHTQNAVGELKLVVKELRNISKNTKTTSTGYDRGI